MNDTLKTLIELWSYGIPLTPERHAFAKEVHAVIGELLDQASPEDLDSPSRLTGKEIFDVLAVRIGGKLLGKFS